MTKNLALILVLLVFKINAQVKPIKIVEEQIPNRIAFYAINETEKDYDVLINIKGTNFRQSAAKPRLIRVPATSKVHLKTLILIRGKKAAYTYDLVVNDSLSRRALKKPFEKIILPPKKIKPSKYIVVYTTKNCNGCDVIIDSLNTNNYLFRSYDLNEKPELQEQLAKSFPSSAVSLDSIKTPVVNLGGKLYTWIENYEQLLTELNPATSKENQAKNKHMKTTNEVLENFQIIGIMVRTINKDGQAGKDIKALWDRFFADGILQKIPNKVGADMYNVYTNYESDHLNWYDCILGVKVSSLENVPEGLTGINITKDTYEVFTSQGELPKSVLDTWEHIWTNSTNRAYGADFDVYGPEASDPKNATVKTYVSIK